jgi:predicted ATPase
MLAITVGSPSTAGPLVGRELELERVDETLDALERGDAICLTVEGEPGIGKTRLLSALRARADDRGHTVLAGAAAEFERELPFSVFVDALDAYVASHSLAEHRAWDADLASELRKVPPRCAGPTAATARSPTTGSGRIAPSAGSSG